MSLKNNKTESDSEPKILIFFSLIMMIISLCSIGFYNGSNENLGAVILILGLLFGWLAMPGGLAVYANIFYLIILFKLYLKNTSSPLLTSCMLLLASLTVLFQGYDLGGGIQSVYAWGWGAVFWAISLVALATASFKKDEKLNIQKQLSLIVVILFCILVPVGALRFYQYQQASPSERERLLPSGAAFTVNKLSGQD